MFEKIIIKIYPNCFEFIHQYFFSKNTFLNVLKYSLSFTLDFKKESTCMQQTFSSKI